MMRMTPLRQSLRIALGLTLLLAGLSSAAQPPSGPHRVTVRSTGSCLTLDVVRDATTNAIASTSISTTTCDGRNTQDVVYRTDAQQLVFQSLGDDYQGGTACLQHDGTVAVCDAASGNQQWQVTDDGSFYVQVAGGANQCLTRTATDSLTVVACGDASLADANDQKFDFTGVTTPGIVGQDIVQDTILNFAVSLHSTQVVLAANPGIQFSYMYGGTTADTVFRYLVYPYGCGEIDDPPLVGYDGSGNPDQSQAIFLATDIGTGGFTLDPAQGTLAVNLGIDLSQLEDATDVWFQEADNQEVAHLKLCGRLEIMYQDMKVNFHEANLDATVDLTTNDGFTLTGVDVNLDRAAAASVLPDVSIDYPVEVKYCAADTTIIEQPPRFISQGFPIQLCVYLQDRETIQDVHVVDIEKLEYWSSGLANDPTTAIDAGVPDVVTELNCQQQRGICRMKWVPLAKYFLDLEAGASNTLMVGGLAVLAFGDAPETNQATGGRRLLRVPVTGTAVTGDRHLQELVETGGSNPGGVSVMDQELGAIRPNKRKRNKSAGVRVMSHMVLPTVVSAVMWFLL